MMEQMTIMKPVCRVERIGCLGEWEEGRKWHLDKNRDVYVGENFLPVGWMVDVKEKEVALKRREERMRDEMTNGKRVYLLLSCKSERKMHAAMSRVRAMIEWVIQQRLIAFQPSPQGVCMVYLV